MSADVHSVIARAGSSVASSASTQASSTSASGSTAGTAAGGTGAGASYAGYASGAGGGSPDQLISVWVDYSALIIVAFFMLVALPRLFARLTDRGASGWTSGFILRKAAVPSSLNTVSSGSRNARSAQLYRQPTNATLRGDVDGDSNQSHTLAAHGYSYGQTSKYAAHPSSSAAHLATIPSPSAHAPAHLRSPSSLFHPISSLFSYSYAPGKTVGSTFLTLAYVTGLLVAVFIDGGDPLVDPERAGWIAIALVPIVVALGTKNNLVGMLIGMGYERLNPLHQFLGWVAVFLGNIHMIGYLAQWANAGILSTQLAQPNYQAGIAAIVGFNILLITSKPFFRKHAYPLFLTAHIVGIIVVFVALCYHKPPCVPRVAIALGIYGFDHILRLVKTRVCTATLTTLPDLQSTRIELSGSQNGDQWKGWRAGQHVRLRVLSPELGTLGCLFAHPFTIANAPGGAGGLQLIVKKAGLWTNKLYDAAGRASDYAGDDEKRVSAREMRVVVEGPYGGLGNMILNSYAAAVLVAGGSGITFPLAALDEIVTAIRNGTSSVKYIELVWSTRDAESVTPLLPTFYALLSAVETVPGTVLKISIFYTRASAHPRPSHGINLKTNTIADDFGLGYGVGAGTTYTKRGPDHSSKPGSKEKSGSNNAEISVLPVEPTEQGHGPGFTTADDTNLPLLTDERISIQPGRPSLNAKLEAAAYFVTQLSSSASGRRRHSIVNDSRGAAAARGVAVGVCGPGSLVSDVAAAARRIPADIRKTCGGVEVHEEFFGW